MSGRRCVWPSGRPATVCSLMTYPRVSCVVCHQEHLRERTALRLAQRPAGDCVLTDDVTRQLIALGQPERAAQLLLETEPADPAFYTNCLKLVAATSLRLCSRPRPRHRTHAIGHSCGTMGMAPTQKGANIGVL